MSTGTVMRGVGRRRGRATASASELARRRRGGAGAGSESSFSGVSASSTARSITLRSSRTLPGQSCFIISSIVSGAMYAPSPPGVRRQEVLDQERDVLPALAQRRHVHAGDREPVVEVLAEAAAVDLAPRSRLVAATTRTSTVDRLGAADAADLLALEHAQELRLHRERQLADLVEEDGAAVRALERAGVALVAPVNAPRSWPNSSLSISVRRDRAAVEHDERALRARRRSCSASATSSLPAPVSPVTSTVVSDARQLLEPREQLAHLHRAADHRRRAGRASDSSSSTDSPSGSNVSRVPPTAICAPGGM